MALIRLMSLLVLTVLALHCAGGDDRQVLPIREDYSDCDSTDVDENVAISCENGQLKFFFKKTDVISAHHMPAELPKTMGSVAVEGDVILRSAAPGEATTRHFVAGGFGCWTSPPDQRVQGYLFIVLPLRHVFGILRVNEQDPSLKKLNFAYPLMFHPSESVDGLGAVNHIRGECREGGDGAVGLTMWVNGDEVGRATDSHFRGFQSVAIFARSSESATDIRFDNFLVEQVD